MSALHRLAIWSQQRQSWLLLFLTSAALLLAALYFQYSMGLEPCIMCIYQRSAVIAILLASLLGLMAPANGWIRWSALTAWGVASVWGLMMALEHVEIQTAANPFFYSCAFEPNFPSWMPLHHWLPSIFAATGDCGDIDWQWLGMSMPQWMIVIFAVFSSVWLAALLANLARLTRKT